MIRFRSWLMAVVLGALLVGVPGAYYRVRYEHSRRLRVVVPNVLYRSGQLTAAGLEEAIAHHRVRTVINLQNECCDPVLDDGRCESELCRQHGVRYVMIAPDLLPRRAVPEQHPAAIDAFRQVMDDPANHPVLLHCRAGLHRTGVLTAVYRMEYQHWSADRALAELKANGFGNSQATARNDYIMQYVLAYRPRTERVPQPAPGPPSATAAGSPPAASSLEPRTDRREVVTDRRPSTAAGTP